MRMNLAISLSRMLHTKTGHSYLAVPRSCRQWRIFDLTVESIISTTHDALALLAAR